MNTRETTNVNQGHITDVGYHKEHERVAHGYIMKITNVKVENDYMYIVLFPSRMFFIHYIFFEWTFEKKLNSHTICLHISG